MFVSIADLTGAGPAGSRRTGEPIRRHSRPAGQCEGVFWRRTSRQEVRQVVMAARRYDLAGRQGGARNGPLGHVAIEVLELLANLVNYRSGRLDPSLDYLMAKLKRSRDAIVRALAALRRHGFLDWLRRFEPTGNEGRGPQVRQVSNAYRLSLPRRALALLGRYFQTPAAPDDHTHAKAQQLAEIAAHRATLSEVDRTRMDVDPDDPLGAALLRFAQARAARAERESARQTESGSGFIR